MLLKGITDQRSFFGAFLLKQKQKQRGSLCMDSVVLLVLRRIVNES
jgi:hypothetical protein